MFTQLTPTYEVKHLIDNGGYGKVYLAIHKESKIPVAIKYLEKSADARIDLIENEIRIQRSLSHAHICTLYDVIETDDAFFLVTEYLPRGNLLQRITDGYIITENIAQKYFGQMVMAIDYLHSKGICHRDIKPENVMFDQNDNIHLIDFGLSKQTESNNLMATMCGSLYYASPEIFSGHKYTKQTDIWSLGIVLFAMCARRLPFAENSQEDFDNQINSNDIFYPKHFSQSLVNLLEKMLERNPTKRITIAEIKEHLWLQGFNFKTALMTSDRRTLSMDELAAKQMFERQKMMNSFLNDIPALSHQAAWTTRKDPKRKALVQNLVLRRTIIQGRKASPVIVKKHFCQPVFAE